MEAEQFENRFEGSVIAPETGVYEFAVKTENGFRLWINDDERGRRAHRRLGERRAAGARGKEEHLPARRTRVSARARAFQIQGEDRLHRAAVEAAARRAGTHPARKLLRTDRPRELMIVTTEFPADDRSDGYERGTTISKEWDQAVTEAAIATCRACGGESRRTRRHEGGRAGSRARS